MRHRCVPLMRDMWTYVVVFLIFGPFCQLGVRDGGLLVGEERVPLTPAFAASVEQVVVCAEGVVGDNLVIDTKAMVVVEVNHSDQV